VTKEAASETLVKIKEENEEKSALLLVHCPWTPAPVFRNNSKSKRVFSSHSKHPTPHKQEGEKVASSLLVVFVS